MKNPILKNNVRILRPLEYDRLRGAIPKKEHQVFLDTLLYTGMRYIEVQRLQKNKDWYDPETRTVHIPAGNGKKKRKMKDRYVHLNERGANTISLFLKLDKKIPERPVWYQNLKRWADLGKIGIEGICPKMTRKTWESWLLTAYPQSAIFIAMSQGHTQLTAMEHYLNLPFSDTERKEIKKRVSGWGGL